MLTCRLARHVSMTDSFAATQFISCERLEERESPFLYRIYRRFARGADELAISLLRSLRRSFRGWASLTRAAAGTALRHNRRACADIPAVRMPALAAIATPRWAGPWLAQCGRGCAGAS